MPEPQGDEADLRSPHGDVPWSHPGTRWLEPGSGRRDPGTGGRDPGTDGRDPGAGGRDPGTRGRQPPRWRWGSLPGQLGVYIAIAGAALGALVTVLSGSEPGAVLGVFLVTGTAAAALAVQARAVYLIIPVPALAYLVAAVVAGLVDGRAAGISRTALAVGVAQWIASGFIAMSAATALAVALTAVRWPRRKRGQDGAGQPMPPRAGQSAGAQAGRRSSAQSRRSGNTAVLFTRPRASVVLRRASRLAPASTSAPRV